ncbi:MAG TPA: FAD-binding protein [Gemmatales bacterium]|nr:FAD-binding protein [Gemmatales bacterium]HMP60419.1 FAD-binding protein [Gemmatales bacterium]
MPAFAEWGDQVKRQEPLAPRTQLRLGGPAQYFLEPQSAEQLALALRRCHENKLPVRLLGAGTNLLVRDEGVPGAVLHLSQPCFAQVEVQGRCVRAGGGASLAATLAAASQRSLAGMEALVGIPGTVGGALRCNAGSRAGSVHQYLKRVEVVDRKGQIAAYAAEESGPDLLAGDDLIVLAAEFELDPDDADAILKRMRKLWIHKKAHQPFSSQRAARIFQKPRNLDVEQMLEEAGVHDLRIGGARLSERNLNYCVVEDGATARDVLILIDEVRKRVNERLGQHLLLYLTIW